MKRRQTKSQSVDPKQVMDFHAGAQRKLKAAEKALAIDEEAALEIAYEAMLKATIALMLAHGQRLRSGPGHHEAAIQFAGSKLDSSCSDLILAFDRMRRKRNQTLYNIAITTRTEAEQAVRAAREFLAASKRVIDAELVHAGPAAIKGGGKGKS